MPPRHNVTGYARLNGRNVEVTYSTPLFDPPHVPAPKPSKAAASHDKGFAWVDWFGVVFQFTGPQRRVVGHLWKAAGEMRSVEQQQLLDAADCELPRLRDLFRGHAAWDTMIVPDDEQPGHYRLSRPV